MTEKKRIEIKKLAELFFDAKMRYEMSSMMDYKHHYEARKKAEIELALARYEVKEARRNLEDALMDIPSPVWIDHE